MPGRFRCSSWVGAEPKIELSGGMYDEGAATVSVTERPWSNRRSFVVEETERLSKQCPLRTRGLEKEDALSAAPLEVGTQSTRLGVQNFKSHRCSRRQTYKKARGRTKSGQSGKTIACRYRGYEEDVMMLTDGRFQVV